MKKLFLTSMLVFGVIPAFAEPTPESTFPNAANDEYMQENRRYINAATHDNMGVYEGTVFANAQYEDTQYTIDPGYYLPGSSETQTQCNQDGYFCPGNMTVYYSANSQGLSQCPDGFEHSDAGASSDTQCYTACANDYFPHASLIIGNDYYGTGTDTCELRGCVNGYTFVPSTPDLANIIGSTVASDYAWIGYDANSNFNQMNNLHNAAYYEFSGTERGVFGVDYAGVGRITGYAICSNIAGDDNGGSWSNPTTYPDSVPGGTGEYCYCNIDGFIPDGGTKQNVPSSWVFYRYFTYGGCTGGNGCTMWCARGLALNDSLNFRAAIFGTIQSGAASCQANTINITWNGTDSTAINQNNAGTCQYDGDINTPAWATHVPGKTFLGWQFSTTAPQD